ncbi:hypothetical protein M0R45_011108 [Rubus argutus]|uniref:C3H1-type domain-containing protein n=1 Tax=Rubus argutus TaxID=59490 RepID=A0AAW1YC06_RUBAR
MHSRRFGPWTCTGRSPARNGSNPEWSSGAGETGLQEQMWQLGLTSSESYPERPGVPNCVYYMRTGFCGYGVRCRYNHPRDRAAVVAAVRATGDYPERVGEPVCQYYLKTGTCKFGASCKFHHPKHGGGSLTRAPLNIYGYPATTEQFGGQSTGLRVARPPLLPGSYVQGAYGPVLIPPGVVPIPGWSPYSAPLSPVLSPGAQPTVGATSFSPNEQAFPERPGEPECQYYLRTGDCKFGPSCRYHHPRERIVPRTNCLLSPVGLPLRPGVQPCTFYLQNGHCKFGSSCKFDHPMGTMRYSPSASSLDMPVAPYPVGSLLGTLAPSSSSSELRPELISARIPSSGNPSSSSVGLIFSQSGGSVSLSDVQLSSQTSVPISSSRSTRQGGEVRRSS